MVYYQLARRPSETTCMTFARFLAAPIIFIFVVVPPGCAAAVTLRTTTEALACQRPTVIMEKISEIAVLVLNLAKIGLDRLVQFSVEHEWIGSKTLFLVTPGEGLDAKALELAESVGLDAGTLKVFFLVFFTPYISFLISAWYSAMSCCWSFLLL